MTLANRKIVHIKHSADKNVLSKAQKLFNSLIKKIDAEKRSLLAWQEFIPEYQRVIRNESDVLWDNYNALRQEMVHALDRAYENKIFKKADKLKISHLITEISANLIAEHGMDELKELHDKYSDCDFDTIKQDADEIAGEFVKSMMQDMYGVEIDEDGQGYSPERIQAILEDIKNQQDEKQRQGENSQANRKKSEKQLQKEARQLQEQQNISQSIRDVYRKLTSALHPDREQDPEERERKTAIMRQVNTAYAKKDLLRLLELQLQAEQIDQSHLNNIAEDRLKYFNKILKEQLAELQQEILMIQSPFKFEMNLPPYAVLSPQAILLGLQKDMREMKRDIAGLKRELLMFKNHAALKAWLKSYSIPKEPDYDELEGLFY